MEPVNEKLTTGSQRLKREEKAAETEKLKREIVEAEIEEKQPTFFYGKEAYLNIVYARWKRLHIITMIVVLIVSFIAGSSFLLFQQKFHPHCALYAKLSFGKVVDLNVSDAFVVIFNEEFGVASQWGQVEYCNYAIYVPFLSILESVTSIMWFVIRGNYSQQKKALPVWTICGFVTTAVTFVAAIFLSNGGDTLCDSFVDTELQDCLLAQHMNWINLPHMKGFYVYLRVSQITIWLTTHAWLYHSFLSFLRWYINADDIIADEREMKERKITEFLPKVSAQNIKNLHQEEDSARISEEE